MPQAAFTISNIYFNNKEKTFFFELLDRLSYTGSLEMTTGAHVKADALLLPGRKLHMPVLRKKISRDTKVT